ncbi:polysaccharide deacetylase family protein [Hydrogenophaga sp.]|uniref:polysaccharide deacetylase family protein n=1 Tax=Hydrogenophaga sp. TaxID=1904254 RepID=UPI003D12531E
MRKAKHFVRDAAAEVLYASHITRPSLRARNKLTIATFHRVLPASILAQYPLPGIAVTPEELKRFLEVFLEHYSVGTLRDSARLHQSGQRLDKPPLAITFDDGQLDNYRFALPVLDAMNVRASFFVVTDAVDGNEVLWHDKIAYAVQRLQQRDARELRAWLSELGVPGSAPDPVNAAIVAAKLLDPADRGAHVDRLEKLVGSGIRPDWDGMMTWEQIREMRSGGHEIGSHSTSHPILPLVSDEALRHEIDHSRSVLEAQIDHEVRSFCYPNGDYDERVSARVRQAGYEYAVTTQYGINPQGSDPYSLRRIDLQSGYGKNAAGTFKSSGFFLRMTGLLPGMS